MNRKLSTTLAIATAAIGAAALPSAASACTAGTDISDQGLSVAFRGWAVGCSSTWTYSWRLRYYHDGQITDWIKENFSGDTSFSSATHSEPNSAQYKTDCVKFFVYHGTKVGNNKVDEVQDCLGVQGRQPAPDLPEDGPATAGVGPA